MVRSRCFVGGQETYDSMIFKSTICMYISGWTKDSPNYNRIHDVMYAFYDCLCEQVRQETYCSSYAEGFSTWQEATSPYDTNVENISLNQWLYMWGRLCRGTAGMSGENFCR